MTLQDKARSFDDMLREVSKRYIELMMAPSPLTPIPRKLTRWERLINPWIYRWTETQYRVRLAWRVLRTGSVD